MKEILEKYFVGFDFTREDHPVCLVTENKAKGVIPVALYNDPDVVKDIYTRLTKKPFPWKSK